MSTASAPDRATEEFASCAVCGRTILRGERLHDYVDPEGETARVCALCKSHAEASGWAPAAHAATPAPRTGGRRRSGLRLRERLAWRRPAKPPFAAEEPRVREGGGAEPPGEPARVSPPEPPSALDVFNASAAARQVAGLTRSLGEPRATVRQTADGELITVAWELSWYQWGVSGGEVSEVAKGRELAELAAEDREWNASPVEGGRLVLD